jgi:hypothetical protein
MQLRARQLVVNSNNIFKSLKFFFVLMYMFAAEHAFLYMLKIKYYFINMLIFVIFTSIRWIFFFLFLTISSTHQFKK